MEGQKGGDPLDGETEVWHPARLIPVSGIRGQEDQEKRATSSLPDGALVVERGKTGWRSLVEVKTGSASLTSEQVSRYLDVARLHSFDAVVTISNDLTPSPEESPVVVDGRKTRSVNLRHLSWWQILTEAIVQHRYHGIEDPDQAWILAELIAYLDHENSGASGFQDMGDKWVKVRNAARNGTLRASDSEVHEIASRWDQLVAYLCLSLSQDLGREVKPIRPRKQTTEQRREGTVKRLAESGTLDATLRVPDAAGDLTLEADLRSRDMRTSVELNAPQEGRPKTRVTWLIRQLRSAPDDVRVDVAFPNVRETTSLLLGVAREYPERLLSASDPKRPPRAFTITLSRPLGTKRGRGEASFVRETRRQAIDFYRDLVQELTAWRPKAPQYRDDSEESAAPAAEPDGLIQPPSGVGHPAEDTLHAT